MLDIPSKQWARVEDPESPFADYAFLGAMERSGILGEDRGQRAYFLTLWDHENLVGALPLFLKGHSYGEYIFDWSWANACERAGISYYPKLVSYIPFTPSSCAKILTARDLRLDRKLEIASELISHALELESDFGASSLHFLFTNEWEQEILKSKGLMPRASFQYHWRNQNYMSFEGFLGALKSRKSKAIRKERQALKDLKFSWKDGHELTREDAEVFYRGYLNTISSKGAMAYLSLEFFQDVFTTMKEKVLVSFAHEGDTLVAMSLFFRAGTTLYGRYWAPLETREFLHFELCYYQGIEYAIKHGLSRFEAGAQGEHKIARGFMQTLTMSSHSISNPGLEKAVSDFLILEAREVDEAISYLSEASPYRDTK